MISTPLKNISQNGNLPQIGVKIKKYLKPPPSQHSHNSAQNLPILFQLPFVLHKRKLPTLQILACAGMMCLVSHRIHGTGIFTYIENHTLRLTHQPFIVGSHDPSFFPKTRDPMDPSLFGALCQEASRAMLIRLPL